ncbi:MAG: histidine phosphatase family protein [Actinomycetota bacterium]
MPVVVVVRHGETEWSRTGKHTSRTDVALTERGMRQARALGTRLKERRYARVLTSPMRRARDTCECAGFRGERLDDLTEWDYGGYEGITTQEIRNEWPGWSLWRDGCPEGENAIEVGSRADRVIVELRRSGGDVLVFSHGHFLRVLAARWVGLAPEAGAVLTLDAAAVGELGYEREQPVIRYWNLTQEGTE